MFGNNNQQQPTNGSDQSSDNIMNASMPDPISDGSLDTSASTDSDTTFPSGAPSVPSSAAAPVNTLADLPASSSANTNGDSGAQPTDVNSSDLMDLKQQALQHLSPLVSHLDQTPEEKFRTTMMMIQASDDQSLLKEAFESAKAITDDKARAQALLDVINEINYFTQHNQA